MMNRFSLVMLLFVAGHLYGQSTFEKFYGGTASDAGYNAIETSDGGFILTGFTYSMGSGTNDCYVVKTDQSGNVLWEKAYGGIYAEYGISIVELPGGGFLIAGTTTSYGEGLNDYYLLRLNSSGDTLWTKTYGGSGLDSPRKMISTNDGNYLIIGKSYDYSSFAEQLYIIKVDEDGNTMFTKLFGESQTSTWGVSGVEIQTGGYMLVGKKRYSMTGDYDFYITKVNATGDSLWTKHWGTGEDDWLNDIVSTSDGGYIVTGTVNYATTLGDAYFAKLDANGNVVWSHTLGNSTTDQFFNRALNIGSDLFYLAGSTTTAATLNDNYLVKINLAGDTLWTKTFGGSQQDVIHSIEKTTDNGLLLCGQTKSFGHGDFDAYIMKTDLLGAVSVPENTVVAGQICQIYPNPVAEYAQVQLLVPHYMQARFQLRNSYGVIVFEKYASGDFCFERGNLPSGLYFYQLESTDGTITGKVILQ